MTGADHETAGAAAGAGEARLRFGAVLLAAGASRRMGRPKLLLPWCATTVLGRGLELWNEVGAAVVLVVHAAGDVALLAELDRLGVLACDRVANPRPERGMSSSIRCAAAVVAERPEPGHWVIALGDQPHLRRDTLRQLLAFAGAHPDAICQPAAAGRPAHPVVLPRAALLEFGRSPDAMLREFLARHAAERQFLETGDSSLELDLDRPEDYERARELG